MSTINAQVGSSGTSLGRPSPSASSSLPSCPYPPTSPRLPLAAGYSGHGVPPWPGPLPPPEPCQGRRTGGPGPHLWSWLRGTTGLPQPRQLGLLIVKCNLHHKHSSYYQVRRQLRDYCLEDCMSTAYLEWCGGEREEGSFGSAAR